ncbi:hypothetical protein KSL4_0613 [Leuconostoc inhae]|nr:hypothetical protein KSL4_0613 [Leuconostoc inhae]
MDEVTLTWDIQKGKWTTTAKDTAAFLKAHGGNKLQIMFHPVVKDDATGVLKNTAVQNDFGQEYQTDTVENNITPDPKPTPVTPVAPEKTLPNTGSTNILSQAWQAVTELFK